MTALTRVVNVVQIMIVTKLLAVVLKVVNNTEGNPDVTVGKSLAIKTDEE